VKGFREENGCLIDERPRCYVCEEKIDWETETIKMEEGIGKTKITKQVTVDVEPLYVGGGLFRHRGYISPKCEPDSDFYLAKFGFMMKPDIKNALEEGKLREKEKKMEKKEEGKKAAEAMKARIMEANKQLANAIDGGKSNLIEAYQKKVKKLVDEAGEGKYAVDELGYAVQTGPVNKKKPTKPEPKEVAAKEKKEPKEAKPKTMRACGCGCGEMVGGYFKMGHDGRVKGLFLKVEKGEMKEKELNASVAELFKIHKANPGLSLREVAENMENKNSKKK